MGLASSAWFNDNHIAMGLVQLLLAGIIMVINQKFLSAALVYGIVHQIWIPCGTWFHGILFVECLCTFAMTRALQVDGDSAAVMNYMMISILNLPP